MENWSEQAALCVIIPAWRWRRKNGPATFPFSEATLFAEGARPFWCQTLRCDVLSLKPPKRSTDTAGIPLAVFKGWTRGDIFSGCQSVDRFEM